jgi:succinoglycan biosynthesis protein ExoW
MIRTNVIIPFYQRDPGILPVAVASALAQGGGDIQVTVVDDGSPVAARTELAPLMAGDPRIVIIEQANAGPGAARNRGLDATGDEFEAIAFLDSDDRWLPGHVANGRAALGAGADLYFADCLMGEYPGHWVSSSRFAALGLDASAGRPVGAGTELFIYNADLFDHMLRRSIIHTSAVIFRRSVAPDLRFETGLVAGEDNYFWLTLTRAVRTAAFSLRCEVACGRGVNIYANAGWGTPASLRSILDTAKFHRLVAARFALTAPQRRHVADSQTVMRRSFAASLLHLLRRREPIDWRIAAAYLAMEPRLAGDIALALPRALGRRASATREGRT